MFGLIAGVYPCNCTAESDEGIAVECDNTNLGITRLYLTSYSDLYTYYSPLNVWSKVQCDDKLDLSI